MDAIDVLRTKRDGGTMSPEQITNMTPYVTTLLVLAFASQRLRMPAADGLPYRRGQGG